VESARQLLSGRDFQPFLVEWQEPESGQWRTEVVMRVVAERVTYFGNCLKSLVPGEELAREDLHVILFKNKSRWKYLQYGCQLIGLRLGVPPKEIRDVELVRARELVCREASNADVPDGGSGVRAEVLAATDGELLGRLPVRLSIAPDAVTVLRPSPSSAIY
jgi:diacylglycerol kinase family enzyme